MNISELIELWKADSIIDRTELGDEALRIPKLHSKYYNMFVQERLVLKKYEQDYKDMYRVKYEYYNGILSEEELKEHNLQPFPMRILKSDMSIYMDSDKHLSNIQSKIAVQKEKVDFLESVIKSLTTRGYNIRAAIDWAKFAGGVG